MPTVDWNALYKQAQEEGSVADELLPVSDYEGEVTNTNTGKSQGGKDQVGIRLRVLSGPHAGAGVWANQTLTLDNPKAMGMWFSQFGALGVTLADFSSKGLTGVAESLVGKKVKFKVTHREWPKGSGTMKNNVTFTGLLDAPAAAPAAAAAATPPPAQPTFVPPAAPAPTAAPAAPAPTPAPAAPAAAPTDELAELRARLAAAEAAQQAVPTPAAPAAGEAPVAAADAAAATAAEAPAQLPPKPY